MNKKIFFISLLSVLANTLMAQPQESADFMRSTGKIYVVVAVLVTIFVGIVFFLISLERKISKFERQLEE